MIKIINQLAYLASTEIFVNNRTIFGQKEISDLLIFTKDSRAKKLFISYLSSTLVALILGIIFKEKILLLNHTWLICLAILAIVLWLAWKAWFWRKVVCYQQSKYYQMNQEVLTYTLQYIERVEKRHEQYIEQYKAELETAYKRIDAPFKPYEISLKYQEEWDQILQTYQADFSLQDEDIEHLRSGQFHFNPHQDENEEDNFEEG